jgi:hypothetical protein
LVTQARNKLGILGGGAYTIEGVVKDRDSRVDSWLGIRDSGGIEVADNREDCAGEITLALIFGFRSHYISRVFGRFGSKHLSGQRFTPLCSILLLVETYFGLFLEMGFTYLLLILTLIALQKNRTRIVFKSRTRLPYHP